MDADDLASLSDLLAESLERDPTPDGFAVRPSP
jgi:hypothetical protein